ncbi:membrane protein [Paradesulfitobacterium aromaticivorans]
MNVETLPYLSTTILFFALYSFLGWVLEFIYRSLTQKEVVNPGFLSGPFLPIYGTFALLVLLCRSILAELPLVWQFLILTMLSTGIEYGAGYLLESVFHLQLWSYRHTPLNYKGRIALPYALLWGMLGLFFLHYIHPYFETLTAGIPPTPRILCTLLFLIYFFWDISKSSLLLLRLERFLQEYREKELNKSDLLAALRPFRRLLATYPKMRHTLSEAMAQIRHKQEYVALFLSRQRQKLYHRLHTDQEPRAQRANQEQHEGENK